MGSILKIAQTRARPAIIQNREVAVEVLCSKVSKVIWPAITKKTPAEKLTKKCKFFSIIRPIFFQTENTPASEANITTNELKIIINIVRLV